MKNFRLKIIIFSTFRNCCILHGYVFVMSRIQGGSTLHGHVILMSKDRRHGREVRLKLLTSVLKVEDSNPVLAGSGKL